MVRIINISNCHIRGRQYDVVRLQSNLGSLPQSTVICIQLEWDVSHILLYCSCPQVIGLTAIVVL